MRAMVRKAPHTPLVLEARPHVATKANPLEQANAALDDLRAGRVSGAAVLVP